MVEEHWFAHLEHTGWLVFPSGSECWMVGGLAATLGWAVDWGLGGLVAILSTSDACGGLIPSMVGAGGLVGILEDWWG